MSEAAVAQSRGSISKTFDRHLPGEAGIWIFILGDMLIFSLFFCVFTYYRALDVNLFIESQSKLNQNFGAFNTLLLLSSSWFVVMGLQAVRKNRALRASRLFGLGLMCGIGFSIVKFFEYGEKIRHGIYLTTNDFFMYYYIFTGIHFLHVIIGMAVLIFLILKARKGNFTAHDIQTFEAGAAYWHMVDLLWIVLFPLLYLVK